MLSEPPRSAGDLQFRIANYPVRITPSFWVAAVLLGWGASQGNPHQLLAWVIAVVLSILIHELGHAIAFRYYGIVAYVVLYHFGGLAVPTSATGSPWSSKRFNQVIVSIAGPVAQLLAAFLLGAALLAAGYGVPISGFVQSWLNIPTGPPFESFATWTFFYFFTYASVYWALLNLLPIYPLDGGMIARELFLRWDQRDPLKHSLILSIIVAGIIAIQGIRSNDIYLGIMFGMLAFSSYSSLQFHMASGGSGREW